MKNLIKHMNLYKLVAIFFFLSSNPSQAQGVRPVDVQTAFANAVIACSKAVGRDVALETSDALEQGTITPADPNRPALLTAGKGEKLYDVGPAKGIAVILVDTAKNCRIMAYGPRVLPTYALVEKELKAQSSQWTKIQQETTPEDFIERYEHVESDGSIVHVFLMGGEPGMGSRIFRFPLLGADVKRYPANYLEAATAAFADGALQCAKAMHQAITLDSLPSEELRDWTLLEQRTTLGQTYRRYGMTPINDIVSLSSTSTSNCYIGAAWLDAEGALNASLAKLLQTFPSLKEVSRRDRNHVRTILLTFKDTNQSDVSLVFTVDKIGGVSASEKRARLTLLIERSDQQR